MPRVVALCALLTILTVLGAEPALLAPRAADYYLKIKDIPGEATDGSIALAGFAWDSRAEVGRFAEYTAPREAASAVSSGRRMHKPLTIVKEVDKASPKLMEACVKGTHVGNVEVWARDGGQATLRYTLQDAIISSYSISGPSASSPRPTESVSFSFEKIVLGPTGPEAVGASTAPRAN